MSSLWSALYKKKPKINMMPSPTIRRVLKKIISRVKKDKVLIERISVPISVGRDRSVRASMTVEAALLLPMVMFFFLHIMSSVEMLRFHGKLCFALWECGNQLTLYAAMPGELAEKVPDMAVSYLYVGNRVQNFLGKDYLDNSPVVLGGMGLNYLSSAYDEGCIDIGVTYQVKPPLTIFPFPYMRMANRYYGKAWTGYDIREVVRYVYVTLYGEVWHATAECTHIFITVQETQRGNIGRLRNANGRKYTSCELCGDEEAKEFVYYTPQGTRYHNTDQCSSLTRYISAIPWQEDLVYRPCSRCVGGKGAEE